MDYNVGTLSSSLNWGRASLNWAKSPILLQLFTVFALLILPFLLGAPGSITLPTPRAQPELLALAAQNPDATFGIIVQKTTRDSSVENAVIALQGRVTPDLWIINGFAAELKGRDIPTLARAAEVRWVSLDAPVHKTDCGDCTTTSNLTNVYIKATNANKVWSTYQGQGIGVAVVDSGVNWQTDLYTISGVNRVVANVAYNNGYNQTTFDNFGHGSHVAGVIGGNGRMSNGTYIGVAPQVNIINVKVSDDLNYGQGTAKSVIQGLQWILQNKYAFNIRVVNLSINSAVAESHDTNPIDAAVEVLWFNKIVVIVSAGKTSAGALYPPANDPFVITVGSVDDQGTAGLGDDLVSSFSAYGKTEDGIVKPDLVAPGRNIVSLMGNSSGSLPTKYPDHIVSYNGAPVYFRISGTSAAAPIVAGAAALLLQSNPNLNPDQVKYRLMATANKGWPGYSPTKAGAGYLDVYAAITQTPTGSANTGVRVSNLLTTGSNPVTGSSINWNSINWNSINWNSINWNSVSWTSINWNSDYWGQ